MSVHSVDVNDPALVTEVDLARAAAQEEAGDEPVGAYVSHQVEDEAAVTHLFEADKPGYHGWRWAVTVTSAGHDADITVSEVVLLPGPSALVAPEWIPWQDRVQAGDLGVGDLLPTDPDDPRLVPAYLESDDEAVEEVAMELGLGRPRVMARPARLEAAARWQESEFGPRSDMARSAPAHCGTCGFYLPLAGALRASFGSCGNELAPADGHVVHTEYGCGAHSEAEVEQVSPVLVANLIYDDALLDVEPLAVVDELPAEEPVAVEEVVEPVAATEAPAAPEAVIAPASEQAPTEAPAEPAEILTEPADSAPEAVATSPALDSVELPSIEQPSQEAVGSESDSPASESIPVEQPAPEIADPASAPLVSDSAAEVPPAPAAELPSLETGEPTATEPAVSEQPAPEAPVSVPTPEQSDPTETETKPVSPAVPTIDELAATEPADGPDLDDDPDETLGPIAGLTGSEDAPPAVIEPVVSREAHPRDDGPGA